MIDLEDGERVIIIGTAFKDMPLRPSVLDEYRDEATLQGETPIVAIGMDKYSSSREKGRMGRLESCAGRRGSTALRASGGHVPSKRSQKSSN